VDKCFDRFISCPANITTCCTRVANIANIQELADLRTGEGAYARELLLRSLELISIDQELCRLEVEKSCVRPRLWAAKWPWGLDLLFKAFWHGQNRTVCEFFYQISELSGPTHEQRLRRLPGHLSQAKLTYSQWVLATLGRRLQKISERFSTHNTKVQRSNRSEHEADID
jgi:hypothetical protein